MWCLNLFVSNHKQIGVGNQKIKSDLYGPVRQIGLLHVCYTLTDLVNNTSYTYSYYKFNNSIDNCKYLQWSDNSSQKYFGS